MQRWGEHRIAVEELRVDVLDDGDRALGETGALGGQAHPAGTGVGAIDLTGDEPLPARLATRCRRAARTAHV